MKTITLFFVLSLIFILTPLSFAESSKTTTTNQDNDFNRIYSRLESANDSLKEIKIDHSNYKIELEITNNSIKEIRRDQLNYKIEKDILKETYSSNIQTINTVITIILGLFTIVGFIAIKSIYSLKDEFNNELKEIKNIREKQYLKFTEIEKEQLQTQDEYVKLKASTDNQEKRLKVLEVQEKASSLIGRNNYTRALSYIAVGLDLEPNDSLLLTLQMACYMKLKQIPEAIRIGNIIIEHDPDNLGTTANLCELHLISNDFDSYETLWKRSKTGLIDRYSAYIEWYYDALNLTVENNLDGYKEHLQTLETKLNPINKSARINKWSYSEAKILAQSLEEGELKTLFHKTIIFLEGNLEIAEIVV